MKPSKLIWNLTGVWGPCKGNGGKPLSADKVRETRELLKGQLRLASTWDEDDDTTPKDGHA